MSQISAFAGFGGGHAAVAVIALGPNIIGFK